MYRYLIKRILLMIPIIIFVSFVIFILMELTPGTIIDGMISEAMTPEARQELIEYHNLHRSVFYRYGLYMLNLVQGDLGVSDTTGASVANMFFNRLPNTLLLVGTGLVIAVLLAVPLGVLAAKRAGSLVDNFVTVISMSGMSMPPFWLGILLLLLFSFHLGWLPAAGNRDGVLSLIMPAMCTALMMMAITTRQARSSVLGNLKADFLRTARAKGVPEKTVVRKHALGNSWIPIITQIGSSFAVQLAGSVVVETVFSWPGIGLLTAQAIMNRDVTQATGNIIMTSIMYGIVQLIVDMSFALVDPRIKAQYSGKKKKKKTLVTIPAAESPQLAFVAASVGSEVPLEGDLYIEDKDADAQEPAHTQIVHSVAATYADTVPRRLELSEPLDSGAQSRASPYREATSRFSDEDVVRIIKANRKRSQLGDIFYRLRKNKGAFVGLIVLSIMLMFTISSIFIPRQAIIESNVRNRLAPPSSEHWFGSDTQGRDLFVRTIYGTRYSLAVGFGAVTFGLIFGVLIGTTSGYFGGKVDDIVMRFADAIASIPGILFGMVIMVILGPSLRNLIIAVGITLIPGITRAVRSSVLQISNSEYVEAARAIGLSNFRIMFTQVLPNGLSPVIVSATAFLGISIVHGATLSFLGFGIPSPAPEWGLMVAQGRDVLRTAPWISSIPGVFIMMAVLAFNLVGDGLRDALDPKMKR
ncbi:MAG: ABC transporter permease subunit [Oscillospiraceae bacterium]|nr:ABC transporter permease subunit [Oscillospiraceae bacterium]